MDNPQYTIEYTVFHIIYAKDNYSVFNQCLRSLQETKQVEMIKDRRYGNVISLQSFHYAEEFVSGILLELLSLKKQVFGKKKVSGKVIAAFETENAMCLDPLQKQAVNHAPSHRVSIVTGGPGTGKTTTVNAIIYGFEGLKEEVV